MTANYDRASRFALLLDRYDESFDTALIDLLADAQHWCHEHGEDFGESLRIAQMHFEAERREGE